MTDPKDLWPVEPLTAATRARMIAQASAGPQLLPWPRAFATAVERALSEWRYALPYKLAAGCACIALGLGIGLTIEPPHERDVAGLAFMASTAGANGEVTE